MSGKITEDWLLGQDLRIFQPRDGYRAGLDAVLLAASLAPRYPAQYWADFGCGAGGALLPALWRLTDLRVTGIERDPQMASLAERGLSDNGFAGRADILCSDIGALPDEISNTFDGAFANPPFFAPDAITPPSDGRKSAFLADVPLTSWVMAMLKTVKRKGSIVLIHRAEALEHILFALHGKAGQIEVLPVRPKAGEAAKRIIVRARKGLAPGGLKLHAGLDLYDDPSARVLTQRAEAVMKGGALEWR